MNLEILFFAGKYDNNNTLYDIAVSHASTTLKNHFRSDGSCYHVVDYNPENGEVILKETRQGYADESAWARGQAWALYGFTMAYRETNNKSYLNQAVKTALFLINHKNMPDDGIPYWDFDAPGIPDEPRDASAAAIICSALLELQDYVDNNLRDKFFAFARKQLKTLCSGEYMADPGENGFFILKHSTGSKPENSEVDVPLPYADYYFLESIKRYIEITENTAKN